jgi:hypothetical protein
VRRGFVLRSIRDPLRSAVAGILLAGALLGSVAYHNHSILAPDSEVTTPDTDQFLTRHDPTSRALHCHAVVAVTHEQDCVACHAQRLPGALALGNAIAPVSPSAAAIPLSPALRVAASLLPSGSRAPPVLS